MRELVRAGIGVNGRGLFGESCEHALQKYISNFLISQSGFCHHPLVKSFRGKNVPPTPKFPAALEARRDEEGGAGEPNGRWVCVALMAWPFRSGWAFPAGHADG